MEHHGRSSDIRERFHRLRDTVSRQEYDDESHRHRLRLRSIQEDRTDGEIEVHQPVPDEQHDRV